MLYGPPGGGKTAFIKALAHYTGRHIIVFPISSQTNLTSIQEIMRQEVIEDTYGIPHEKRIYVFEDFHLIGDTKIDWRRRDDSSSSTWSTKGSSSSSTSVVKPTDGMEALDKLKIKAKEIYEEENAENAENVEKEKNAKKKKKKKKKKYSALI
eukprot:Trichotokara_eunicae@DN2502_c0_g1_i3.p1